MNNYQKEIIEKIIKKLQENTIGMMHKDVLNKYFDNKNIETSIMSLLINDLKYIELADETAYRLTKEGFEFKSFKSIDKKKSFNEKKEITENENLNKTLKLNKWLLKTKWLPYFISIISFLFSVYTYFDAKKDNEKLEKRITELEIKKTDG